MFRNKTSKRSARSKTRADNEAGFTLTELMVVIVIIGLLTTVVVINVLPSQEKAMVEKAKADIHLLEQAIELYRLDMNVYPTTEQGLEALVAAPSGLKNANKYRTGGYIKRLPNDPWGMSYQFLSPGEHGPFDIYSLGSDQKLGGDEAAKDIGNWD